MRTPFEKLMMDIEGFMDNGADATMGELAEHYGEPIERIMDAISAVRVLHGEGTYL